MDHGRTVGILTRNSLKAAKETLASAGLDRYFDDRVIVGRDTCAPKPRARRECSIFSNTGRPRLRVPWSSGIISTICKAGRAAGSATVHFDVTGRFRWPHLTDPRRQSSGAGAHHGGRVVGRALGPERSVQTCDLPNGFRMTHRSAWSRVRARSRRGSCSALPRIASQIARCRFAR